MNLAEQTTVVVVCSLLGKFFSAMQNVTIVMQTSELFHTPVRGIVVALCSTAGKVGGIVSATGVRSSTPPKLTMDSLLLATDGERELRLMPS